MTYQISMVKLLKKIQNQAETGSNNLWQKTSDAGDSWPVGVSITKKKNIELKGGAHEKMINNTNWSFWYK